MHASAPEDVQAVRRALVLAPNWLGDAAMCTPALRALRRRYPDAEITVAARAGVCALLEGLPYFDRLVPLPARPGIITLFRLARSLRGAARDLAVIFPHSFRAALFAWLAGSRTCAGYARGGRSWLLTLRVPPHREDGRITPIYMAHEYLGLTAALGCEDDGAGLALAVAPADAEAVRQHVGEARPLVGIAPGAAFGPSKRWLPERFAAVADALHERAGAGCVLLTGPGEEDVRDAVRAAARFPLPDAQGDAPGIGRLKAAVAHVDLLVCNDTGPRHLAVAFHKPVVCIMGSTSPRYTDSPWERGEVLRVEVDCGPCQKPVCATDHRCMTGVGVEPVVAAVLRHLESPSRP